jgi:hypothetical protein
MFLRKTIIHKGFSAISVVTHAIVKRMMKDGHIGAADQELVSTRETKAENTITWARNALKQRGHINRASNRGT